MVTSSNQPFESWGTEEWMRASQFERLPISPGDIVFLGDSITEGGLWSEWFPAAPVKNRGIGGDSAVDVLGRVDTALANGPAAVFLLVGTNDLVMGTSDDGIVSQVGAIVAAARSLSGDMKIFLQSIMPRKADFATRIRALNVRLKNVAESEGAIWIDLWPTFDDGNGGLKPDFSLDSLHLNGDGYSAWVNVLRDYVESTLPPNN